MKQSQMNEESWYHSSRLPRYSYDTLLQQAAERYPSHPAIIYQNRILTYQTMASMVRRVAHGLYELGLRKGDCLCLFMSNRPEYLITFIAAASIGVIVTPLNHEYKEREVLYQLENAEVKAIVLHAGLFPTLSQALALHPIPTLRFIITIGDTLSKSFLPTVPFVSLLEHSLLLPSLDTNIHPDDLLALPYSSGTTGQPKGVMLAHSNLIINHFQFIDSLGLSHADVALLFLPLSHIYGMMVAGSFLACGGTLVLMDSFDLERSLALCERYLVTYYFVVPSLIVLLERYKGDLHELKQVKCLYSGATSLPLEVARRLQKKIAPLIVQAYGLTEASPLTHAQPHQRDLWRLESIGKPVSHTRQKIMDLAGEGKELSIHEIGEIVVKGPQIMKGYWKAEAETKEIIRDGWLSTGDIGYVDAEGYTYIVGRKKDMIKHKGFSISPGEIENILLEHPAVHECAVIGVPGHEVGEYIKAFVVLKKGEQDIGETLIDFVNDQVAHYKRVHFLEIIEVLPRTPSGKVLRRALHQP
ncbi:hypothetical protein EPA93_14795 [Ktedonosporobacter rubrisoli]|uniref:Long-chain fatty acid--CoA ligase n=1 Tax=Ktedonosporobacter rubrisoli TaxID=2509675 RepID=A0A4P6JPA2_KTERU|nr:AMP-binding protein [Ktedonosporobacter rubrisoli]QBD77198.1 hypothetical protein EPA93_14795 [Ktedonosporobacter rubrisoli]